MILHTISDMDTLDALALKYLGDATRKSEIIEFNKLEYPYVVTDKKALDSLFGSGYVVVERSTTQNALTVPKGTKFKTKATMSTGNLIKTFESTEEVVIPMGITTAYIPLRCTSRGSYGNVPAGAISMVDPDSGLVFTSVVNEEAFTGGRHIDVKAVGEILYIPSEEVEIANVDSIYYQLGDEDLALSSEGELFIDSHGDIASAQGIDNIRQAVYDRLNTEKSELLLQPEYGTNLASILGEPYNDLTDRRVRLEILECLAYEDRITDVKIKSLKVDKDMVLLDIYYKIKFTGMEDVYSLTIKR